MEWIIWFDLFCYYLIFLSGLLICHFFEDGVFSKKSDNWGGWRVSSGFVFFMNFIVTLVLFSIVGAILLGIRYLIIIT